MAAPPERRPRHGVWSIVLAFVALALVGATLAYMTSLSSDASERTSDTATFLLVAVFLAIAPTLHIIGIVTAVIGMARGAVASGIIGMFLNLILLGLGGFLVYSAFGTIGAFT